MSDLFTSILGTSGQSGLYALPSTGSAPTATSTFAGFGPDFLLGALSASRTGAAAGYTASGLPIGLPENAPQVKQRQADLKAVTDALKVGNLTAAREGVNRVLKAFPNDATATYNLARIQILDGDYDGAEKSLIRVAQSSGDELITSDLRAVRTLKKGDSETVAQIRRLLSGKQTATDGLRLADYFLETHADNAEARLAVADFYERSGNLNLAGAELREAIDNVAPNNLGTVVTYLEGFAARYATDFGSHDLLAQAYAITGDLTSAKKSFTKALELSGDDPAIKSGIQKDFANIYSKIGREKRAAGDFRGARAAFESAIDLRDDDERRADLSDLHFDQSQTYVRRGSYALALRSVNDAYIRLPIGKDEERKDRLLPAYDRIINKLEAVGDLKNLVTARAGAYNQDPADDARKRALANAQNTYGEDLMSQNKYREAFRQFLAATKLYPDDTDYAANLSAARLLI